MGEKKEQQEQRQKIQPDQHQELVEQDKMSRRKHRNHGIRKPEEINGTNKTKRRTKRKPMQNEHAEMGHVLNWYFDIHREKRKKQ